MYHVLLYDFVEDYLERRQAYRAEHLALARASLERGELLLAGALADPADAAILVFRTDDPGVVERFAESDPYVTQGLVTRRRVRPWTVVVGGDASG